MSDDSLDDLADVDDLRDVLSVMQGRITDLEGRVNSLQETRGNLVDELDQLRAENDELRARLDDVGGHIELVDASIDTPRKGKIENIHAILDHAAEKGQRGMKGTMLKTGEVHAAISGSRNTALRLIDEIAATFEWAGAENPGGQRQKRLKIAFGQPVQELKADVTAQYAGREETTG